MIFELLLTTIIIDKTGKINLWNTIGNILLAKKEGELVLQCIYLIIKHIKLCDIKELP